MRKKLMIILTLSVLVLALAACSSAAGTSAAGKGNGRPNEGTAVATFVTSTATTAPTATAAPTETATAEPTLTATAESYTSTVITSIGCQSGPGEDYSIISFLSRGDTIVTYGRNESNDYYYVLNPNSGKPCWVWGNYITVNSPSYELPIATTPTVTPTGVDTAATVTPTAAQ